MKIRQAEFSLIPMWVLRHPDLLGKPAIATYAQLRALSYEHAEHDWASLRIIAEMIDAEFGSGFETVRKHLGLLQRAGAITIVEGELVIPSDEPGMATGQTALLGKTEPSLGKALPNSGQDSTQTPLLQEDKRVNTRDSGFEAFWRECPKKIGKCAAEKAWKGMSAGDRERAAASMPLHRAAWVRKKTQMQYIPHPSTWLNQRRWEDEIDSTPLRGREQEGLHEVVSDGQRIVGSAWS